VFPETPHGPRTDGRVATDRDRAAPGSLTAHPAIAGRQAALHIALARVPLGHAQNQRIHEFRFSGNWEACLVFLVYTAVLAVKACARALARARKSLREP
jgi:hypothetical protein